MAKQATQQRAEIKRLGEQIEVPRAVNEQYEHLSHKKSMLTFQVYGERGLNWLGGTITDVSYPIAFAT